jgi:hypothetical protein
MERVIPNNLEKAILFPLMGPDSEKQTQQNYTKKIEKFEKECEKSCIKTRSR